MGSTFDTKSFGSNGAATRSLGKPPAIYPAAVATDAALMLAVDRQQTRLAQPLDTVATSMTVEDAALITAYNLLSIDDEIVKTTGPPAGNVVPIARGFDGTAPVIHLASAVVSGLIDAYHHNALAAEIQAIEQALGANLGNVQSSEVSLTLDAGAHDFTAQSPAGALIVGNNVITLAPVPAGVNATDAGHYLYVSGTGTPEASLITGGSAVGGAASGTLIIQCANAHPAGWTIRSATGGVAEAVNMVPHDNTGGTILLPCGTRTFYAPVNLDRNGIIMRGISRTGSRLKAGASNTVFFTSTANGYATYVFEDFYLEAFSLTAANANVGFQFHALVNVVWQRIAANNVWRLFDVDRGNSFTVRDVWTWGESNAKFYDSTNGSNYIRWVNIDGWHAFAALSWDSEPVIYFNWCASGTIKNVFTVLPGSTGRGHIFLDRHQEDISVDNVHLLGGTFGLQAKDVYFSDVVNSDFDGTGTANMIMDGVLQWKIANCNFSAGNGGDLIQFKNTIPVATGQVTIVDNNFGGIATFVAGNAWAIRFMSAIQDVSITGNTFSNLSWKGVATGIEFTDAASSNFTISGNAFSGMGPADIVTISNANPAIVTTAAAHPYSTGGQVYFEGATGSWTPINAPAYFPVTVIDSTHFSIPLNTTAFGAYGAQNIKYQSVSFDVVDPTPSTTPKSLSGNTWTSRSLGLYDFYKGDIRTVGSLIHVRNAPTSGTDTLLAHVNATNSASFFSLVMDSAAEHNYSFKWPSTSTVFFEIFGVSVVVLTNTAITLNAPVNIPLANLQVFADNAAAASLPVGRLYRTATGQLMIRY